LSDRATYKQAKRELKQVIIESKTLRGIALYNLAVINFYEIKAHNEKVDEFSQDTKAMMEHIDKADGMKKKVQAKGIDPDKLYKETIAEMGFTKTTNPSIRRAISQYARQQVRKQLSKVQSSADEVRESTVEAVIIDKVKDSDHLPTGKKVKPTATRRGVESRYEEILAGDAGEIDLV